MMKTINKIMVTEMKIGKHDFMRYNAIYLSWKVLMHELLLFIFLITIHKNDDADDQNATEN